MKLTTSSRSRSRAASRERHLCQFPYSDGRRCRMLRLADHPCLCVFHARAEAQAREVHHLGAELAQTMSGDFMSATDINFAMGRLYAAVAQERIPIRNANALARIGRIMLATVPTVKKEFPFTYTFEEWNDMFQKTEPLSPLANSFEPGANKQPPPALEETSQPSTPVMMANSGEQVR